MRGRLREDRRHRGLFVALPGDRGPVRGHADDIGALQSEYPKGFRKPPVITDRQSDTADRRIKDGKAAIARFEPKVLLIPQMRLAERPDKPLGADQHRSPEEKAELLRIGVACGHEIARLLEVTKPATYKRWLARMRSGRSFKALGTPRLTQELRDVVMRIGSENLLGGYKRITWGMGAGSGKAASAVGTLRRQVSSRVARARRGAMHLEHLLCEIKADDGNFS